MSSGKSSKLSLVTNSSAHSERNDQQDGAASEAGALLNIYRSAQGRFMTHQDAKKILDTRIREELEALKRQRGGRKAFSKRNREAIDGRLVKVHDEGRATCCLAQIESTKRRLLFHYAMVTYASTPKGRVYFFSNLKRPSVLTVFVAHFFDRYSERTVNGELDRIGSIFTVLADIVSPDVSIRSNVQSDDEFRLCTPDGMGLGFSRTLKLADGHQVVNVLKTFIAKDQFRADQKKVYDSITRKKAA